MAEQCQMTSGAKAFVGLQTALFVLIAIIMPLRLYTRIRIAKAYGWDDTVMIGTYVIYLATSGMAWYVVSLGLGEPLDCFSPDVAVRILEFQVISENMCLITMTFARLSAVIFVLRILGINKRLQRFLKVWGVYMVIQQLLCALLPFAYCDPVNGFWDPEVAKTAHCWSQQQITAITIFNGVTSIVSDFILAFLPAYFMCRLHLPWAKRAALVALMTVGLIPAACAIGRTILLQEVMDNTNTDTFTTLFIFGGLEMAALIICASAPTLVPLYYKLKYPDGSRPSVSHTRNTWTEHVSRNVRPPSKDVSAQLVELSSASSTKGIL